MWRAVLLSWWLIGSLATCCPPGCRCFSDDEDYKVANCSRLFSLTTGDHANIAVLNFITHNPKLEPHIFHNFRSLKYLNLQNSSISRLPNDVFLGIPIIRKINLSFNKIKNLNGVVFKPLSNLRSLNLRGNFLAISLFNVVVSDSLQELDMGYCNLTSLPYYAFVATPNIRHLILDGNFIQTVEYNVLPRGLTYINLANNKIVNVPINVLSSSTNLLRIDISGNPINCSCSLMVFQDSLSNRAGMMNEFICNNPPNIMGKKISTVNENKLCLDDYAKKNSLNYGNREHPHGESYKSDWNDQGMLNDAPQGSPEMTEVLFSNQDTHLMGSHMEARMSESVLDDVENSHQTTVERASVPDYPKSNEGVLAHDTVSSKDDITVITDEGELDDQRGKESSQDRETFSSSKDDNTISPWATYAVSSLSDFSNTLHALEVGNYTNPSSESEIIQNERISSIHSEEVPTTGESTTPTLSDQEDAIPSTLSDSAITWPTLDSEPADYSYDAAHYDYVYNSTIETFSKGESSTKIPVVEVEGSGDDGESITDTDAPRSTVSFLEDHEMDTVSSFRTVSDDLDTLVNTSHATDEPPRMTFSKETYVETTVSTSSSSEPIESLTVEPSAFSSTESPTVDVQDSSLSSSTEPTKASNSETTYATTTTEDDIQVTLSSSSTKTSRETSAVSCTTESSTSESIQTVISTETPLWLGSHEDKTTHIATDSELDSGFREGRIDSSNEIEIVRTNIGFVHKENIVDSTTTQAHNEKAEMLSAFAFVIPALLLIVIVVILTVVVCIRKRRKQATKVRLPDPEAPSATELQDILLPKSSEKGIKILPNNYTNGSAPVTNGKAKEPQDDKEECTYVLAPDPEPEITWDRPGPIETVTAKLTVTPYPQTPIFIQKPLT